MHNAATVPSTSELAVVRNLAPNQSPISAAIDSVMDLIAQLDAAVAEDRRMARAIVGRVAENERRRIALHALAAELEARLVKRPRRRNAA